MKRTTTILKALLICIIFPACATLNTVPSSIERPIEKQISEFEVIGSIRLEILTGPQTGEYMPYDKLLKMAHEKYGEKIDIVEIKKEKQPLSLAEIKSLRNETKMYYTSRIVYNAIVIKYLTTKLSIK
jgi:hypothetical protein